MLARLYSKSDSKMGLKGKSNKVRKQWWQDFLAVQGLRLIACKAGGLGLIPGQGTRYDMPQLKVLHAAMKIEDPISTAKTWHSQINN